MRRSTAWVLALTLSALTGTSVLCAQSSAPQAPGDTPQGKVVLAFYKAAHDGDVAGLKKCITADMAKDLDGPQGKDIVEMLKNVTPATNRILKVTVTGKTAVVDTEQKDGDTTMNEHVKVVLVGTEWKVDLKSK